MGGLAMGGFGGASSISTITTRRPEEGGRRTAGSFQVESTSAAVRRIPRLGSAALTRRRQ